MTQAEVNRQVARATGETVTEIKHRGFDIAVGVDDAFDAEPADVGQYLDWDEVDAQRLRVFPQPRARQRW